MPKPAAQIERLRYETAVPTEAATFGREENGNLRVCCPRSSGTETSVLFAMIGGWVAIFSGLFAALLYFSGQPGAATPAKIAVVSIAVAIASYILSRHTIRRHDVIVISDDGVHFEQWGNGLEREAVLKWPEVGNVYPIDLIFRGLRFGVEPRSIFIEWHSSAASREEAIRRIREELAARRPASEAADSPPPVSTLPDPESSLS